MKISWKIKNSLDLNTLAKEVHAHNVKVGWWGENPDERCMKTLFQLISTEICEATAGEREDLMDDKLPHRKMGEVELADVLIRVLDFGGYMGLELDRWEFEDCFIKQEDCVAAYHWSLTEGLVELGVTCTWPNIYRSPNFAYEDFIYKVFAIANNLGYDIISAMQEKKKFNETREDHKLENREKKGGKKF